MANSGARGKRVSFTVDPEVWRRFAAMCEQKGVCRTPHMQIQVLVQVFAAGLLDDGGAGGQLTTMFSNSWGRLGLSLKSGEKGERAAKLAEKLWKEIEERRNA